VRHHSKRVCQVPANGSIALTAPSLHRGRHTRTSTAQPSATACKQQTTQCCAVAASVQTHCALQARGLQATQTLPSPSPTQEHKRTPTAAAPCCRTTPLTTTSSTYCCACPSRPTSLLSDVASVSWSARGRPLSGSPDTSREAAGANTQTQVQTHPTISASGDQQSVLPTVN
jgi:hypothetical protein